MGDVNQVRTMAEWSKFITRFGLVDLTETEKGVLETYRGPEGNSALDVVCCPSSWLTEQGWSALTNSKLPTRTFCGHFVLCANLRPSRNVTPQSSNYQRLSNEPFKTPSPPLKLGEQIFHNILQSRYTEVIVKLKN
jgi:hypothetical protein